VRRTALRSPPDLQSSSFIPCRDGFCWRETHPWCGFGSIPYQYTDPCVTLAVFACHVPTFAVFWYGMVCCGCVLCHPVGLAGTSQTAECWARAIGAIAERSVWCRPNRLASFAPPTAGNTCRWLVDGRDTFAVIARHIESAVSEIMVTDWYASSSRPWQFRAQLRAVPSIFRPVHTLLLLFLSLPPPLPPHWLRDVSQVADS
jgi:hypothetical protein